MKWRRKKDRVNLQEQLAKADAQANQAEQEFHKTVSDRGKVADVLAMFFYHAEKNQIIENIQKVARGQG